MDDAHRMEVLDAFKQSLNHSGNFFVRKSFFLLLPVPNEGFQCASRNEFHEQVQAIVGFLKRMEFHNVGMADGL